jgi:hypothetical protein
MLQFELKRAKAWKMTFSISSFLKNNFIKSLCYTGAAFVGLIIVVFIIQGINR